MQELDRYIRARGGVEGIVNGMDVEEWDPRIDKFLTVKYDKNNVYEGKAAAKSALQVKRWKAQGSQKISL
jgi:glycogen synthase